MTAAQELALSAARKYLQSIVFVDDEIYEQVPAKKVTVTVGGGASAMRVFAKPREPIIEEEVKIDGDVGDVVPDMGTDNGGLYHPKYLVESFARERMVCALYEPAKNFNTGADSEVFKLCERADAVILDWEFYKEPGTKVLDLLSGLVTAAQTTVPHHVRLCAIYTSTQNLKHVAQQIFERLQRGGLPVKAEGEYNLNAGSTRIIVLGKPTIGRPVDQVAAAEVAEGSLAERIISEFAAMHEGILPSLALHGLASVRTNAKKILDKFRKEMDGAFLAHRGLILPGDDAFEQVPELLAEEALAVMIDQWLATSETKKLADQSIDALGLKTALPATKAGDTAKAGEYAISLLKEGPDKVRKKVDLSAKALKSLHDDLDADNTLAKERLAALYACRTQYGDERILGFGTVIRYEETVDNGEVTRHYAVCLMPICDSVRLKSGAVFRFPFWNLRADSSGAASKGMVVELPLDEGFIELFSMGKPRDQLWLDDFTAGATQSVTAAKENGRFNFKGKLRACEWIAQLKPGHAQRIAQDIGASMSRVGVLEAEWLRIKAER